MYKLFKGKFPYCLRDIKYITKALKYRVQRALRGWADCDAWNIDTWFLEVMPQILQNLKDNLHTHPGTMTEAEWNSILGTMIFLLSEMNEDTCSQRNDTSDNFFYRERALFNYRDHCKDEFFKLFSKYFWDLWD